LLRVPFVLFDVAFGRLTRGFMLVFFLGTVVASYLLLRHAVKLSRGPDAVPSPCAISPLRPGRPSP
jgi:hypothetical protein